ncbi:MAG: low-specificity L-threonine aldolase [Gammaproteobacteria bacterium]
MSNLVDLRSDTVTRPTPAMRDAMFEAPLGDDVYGEDPTVNRLEALAAEMTGHEAALFATSGTQSNLLGILAHCQRGDEYIVGANAHTYKLEGGGAAVLGSIQPQPIPNEADATMDLDAIRAAIKPDDFHYARSKLLCLENTMSGKVIPLEYMREAGALARENGLGFHLDGARVCNAAVALGVSLETITKEFNSVSVCLSKGLGAPVGSVLVGDKGLIDEARRLRKMVGGGMRQAGLLAAGGIYALENHIDRMAEDHANATRLADGLANVDELNINKDDVQTNMVFMECPTDQAQALQSHLSSRGIQIKAGSRVRLVTHLDVTEGDVDSVVSAVEEFFS